MMEERNADLSTEDVAVRIERMIFGGELHPGAKLREVALAERLGVGRGPIREAIRILEGRRLLVRTRNAGVAVTTLSIEDFEQLLITREALEGMAARHAAENMTLAEIVRLSEVAASMEQADKSEAGPSSVFEKGADNDFHRIIALGSRNRWITHLLCDDLYSLLRLVRFQAAIVRPDPSPSHVEHKAIIDRIQQRDPDGAERLMREHVRGSRSRLLTHLRAAGKAASPVQ